MGILPFANDSRATKALQKHFHSLKADDLKDLEGVESKRMDAYGR